MSKSIALTKALIYAAALDACNHSLRCRGKRKTDTIANDAYYAEFNRLFEFIGGPEGWIDLPAR